jgi:hypothetical protein
MSNRQQIKRRVSIVPPQHERAINSNSYPIKTYNSTEREMTLEHGIPSSS